MTSSIKQQALFFRFLFRLKTPENFFRYADFLRQQQHPVEHYQQLLDQTEKFANFLDAHPTYELNESLNLKREEKWNIYKYADLINVNIYNLSVFNRTVLNEIIYFLRELTPPVFKKSDITQNILTHPHELFLFLQHLDEINRSIEFRNPHLSRICGTTFHVLYSKNNDHWDRLWHQRECFYDIKSCYDALEPNLYEKINSFFDTEEYPML